MRLLFWLWSMWSEAHRCRGNRLIQGMWVIRRIWIITNLHHSVGPLSSNAKSTLIILQNSKLASVRTPLHGTGEPKSYNSSQENMRGHGCRWKDWNHYQSSLFRRNAPLKSIRDFVSSRQFKIVDNTNTSMNQWTNTKLVTLRILLQSTNNFIPNPKRTKHRPFRPRCSRRGRRTVRPSRRGGPRPPRWRLPHDHRCPTDLHTEPNQRRWVRCDFVSNQKKRDITFGIQYIQCI